MMRLLVALLLSLLLFGVVSAHHMGDEEYRGGEQTHVCEDGCEVGKGVYIEGDVGVVSGGMNVKGNVSIGKGVIHYEEKNEKEKIIREEKKRAEEFSAGYLKIKLFADKKPVVGSYIVVSNDKVVASGYSEVVKIPVGYINNSKLLIGVEGYELMELSIIEELIDEIDSGNHSVRSVYYIDVSTKEKGIFKGFINESEVYREGEIKKGYIEDNGKVRKVKYGKEKAYEILEKKGIKGKIVDVKITSKNGTLYYVVKVKKPMKLGFIELPFIEQEEVVEVEAE